VMVARFCEANNWNEMLTAQTLRTSMGWRSQLADAVRAQLVGGWKLGESELIRTYLVKESAFPHLGETKAGDVIWYEASASVCTELLDELTDDEFFECQVVLREFALLVADMLTCERGDGVLCKLFAVIDNEGWDMKNCTARAMGRMNAASVLSKQYESAYSTVLMVNSPAVARSIWSLTQHSLPATYRRVVHVHKLGDPLPPLVSSEHIDSAVLPARYGGRLSSIPVMAFAELGLPPSFAFGILPLFSRQPRPKPIREALADADEKQITRVILEAGTPTAPKQGMSMVLGSGSAAAPAVAPMRGTEHLSSQAVSKSDC